MERCCVRLQTPAPARWQNEGPSLLWFCEWCLWLPSLESARSSSSQRQCWGADGENQWQNQAPRARGRAGMGEASPDPRREHLEAWSPHQKCSIGSTEGEHPAHTGSRSIQQEKSPSTQRWAASREITADKKFSRYHQPKKFPGPHKGRSHPLIDSQPGSRFPSSAALQLQGG